MQPGSVPTGTKVMCAACSDLKKVTLELGGKSPIIVFQVQLVALLDLC